MSRRASGASVRGRLQALGRRRGVELQLLLSEFAIERLLYRLGASRHAGGFVLKGANLLKVWSAADRRATWDLDLLGVDPSTVEEVVAAVREVCVVPAEDAIEFDADSVRGEEIRGPNRFGGVRVRLAAGLAGARIPVQVDIGFGDAVEPAPRVEAYPTLLDHEAPRVLTYPREAVVAEKLEAIVSLGVATTRMKDFHDLERLAALFAFEGETLVRAVQATFSRRGTPIPEQVPVALTVEFLAAPEREREWRAFVRRSRHDSAADAGALAETLQAFVVPVLRAARGTGGYDARWPVGGPWEAAS